MDLETGKSAILQAIVLLKDEEDISKKISNLMDTVQTNKSRSISLFCEALALQKQDADRKKKCVELLTEVEKWWQLLAADREKLLITISMLELEKDALIKKYTDPVMIYGHLLKGSEKKTQTQTQSYFNNLKKSKSQIDILDDDFLPQ